MSGWLWLWLPLAMGASEDRFQDVMREVRGPTFSDQQLDVVRSIAAGDRFTARQAADIISTFTFGRDQITAARLLGPGLEDPENVSVMLAAIGSQPDRERAQAMLVMPVVSGSTPDVLPDACSGGGWQPTQHRTLSEERFEQLTDLLSQQSSASSRLEMLRSQLKSIPQGFSAPQVLALLRRFPEPASRVEAMAMIDPWVLGLTGEQVGAVVSAFELPHDRAGALTVARHWLVDLDQLKSVRSALPRDGSLAVGERLLRDARVRSPLLGSLGGVRLVVVVDGSSAMAEVMGEHTVGEHLRCDVMRSLGQLRRGQRFSVVVASAAPEQLQRGVTESTAAGLAALDFWWAALPHTVEPALLTAIDHALLLDPDVLYVVTASADARLDAVDALQARQAGLAGVTVHTTVLQLGTSVPSESLLTFGLGAATVGHGRSRLVTP